MALRTVIGVGRLCGVTAHIVRGLWIVAREFRTAGALHRHQRIQWWSSRLLQRLGITVTSEGALPSGAHLLVANHVSWLDIIAVHAVLPQARFVSKADVRHWPVIGALVDAAGTLYIERENKRDALRVVHQMAAALKVGDIVAVFPEGTTGDGRHLLPFHANLLQAAIATDTPVLPVALRFSEPGHPVSPSAAYIGDTTLLQSLWRIATAQNLQVTVRYLAPVHSTGCDRRALSALLHERISAALPQEEERR